jgi:nucleoside-diphosphate-sugar epimerase
MKRILVTGSTGFIGRAIAKELVDKGYEVHSCSRSGEAKTEEVYMHKADLLDRSDIARLVKTVKPVFLVHTAWCSGHGTYWTDPANMDWVGANALLSRYFVEEGGQYALFTGTSAEYDWSGNRPLKETDPASPASVYGGAKCGSHVSLDQFFSHYKVGLGWVRLFNPFGPFEDERRLIPKMCNKLIRGETIDFDAGLEKRDFLHVEDVAVAYRRILEENVTGVINVGSGVTVAVRDVVSLIAEAAGCPDAIHFAAPDEGRSESVVVADVSKLKQTTGWDPSQPFYKRICQTVEWWRSNQTSK